MCWPWNHLQILLVFPTKFVKHEEATVYSLALIVIILAAILNHNATHQIHLGCHLFIGRGKGKVLGRFYLVVFGTSQIVAIMYD